MKNILIAKIKLQPPICNNINILVFLYFVLLGVVKRTFTIAKLPPDNYQHFCICILIELNETGYMYLNLF